MKDIINDVLKKELEGKVFDKVNVGTTSEKMESGGVGVLVSRPGMLSGFQNTYARYVFRPCARCKAKASPRRRSPTR